MQKNDHYRLFQFKKIFLDHWWARLSNRYRQLTQTRSAEWRMRGSAAFSNQCVLSTEAVIMSL